MPVSHTTTTEAGPNEAVTAPSLPLVHVVEDEPAIQDLLRHLGQGNGFEVATYDTVEAFHSTFDCSRIGCLVLDLKLPDGSGMDILAHLSERSCCCPVIIMSGAAKVSEAVDAFRLGSLDFLEKPFRLDAMLETIQNAIDTDRRNRTAAADTRSIRERFERLTPREQQVMELVVQGAANKEVASHLGLSPKTVEVHRANVMRKTEATSIAELVRMHVTLAASPQG